jgi:L-glyceraldehyde 3-phosphate reductase
MLTLPNLTDAHRGKVMAPNPALPEAMMQTRSCGNSGLKVSAISLGLMVRDCTPGDPFESVRQTVLRAFDKGITSIDLATGYGGGAVELALGKILSNDLVNHREKLVLATKAGWADGSRKTLTQSLDRSLGQLGVDYVDIYYHHAPDEHTPLEETAAALDSLVRCGKTLYVGVSNYSLEQTIRISQCFRALRTPCVLHQCNYNMLNRWVEDGLLTALPALDMSAAVFFAVNQGLLSDAALAGPREGSRASKALHTLETGVPTGEPAYGKYPEGDVKRHVMAMLARLHAIAKRRGQTLSQMALSWVLRHTNVATALVGMSSPEQVDANAAAADNLAFTPEELRQIADILPPRWGMR